MDRVPIVFTQGRPLKVRRRRRHCHTQFVFFGRDILLSATQHWRPSTASATTDYTARGAATFSIAECAPAWTAGHDRSSFVNQQFGPSETTKSEQQQNTVLCEF